MDSKERVRNALKFGKDIIKNHNSKEINSYKVALISHLTATQQLICDDNLCESCPLDGCCEQIKELGRVVFKEDIEYMKK